MGKHVARAKCQNGSIGKVC